MCEHYLQVDNGNLTYWKSQVMQEAFRCAGLELMFMWELCPQSVFVVLVTSKYQNQTE